MNINGEAIYNILVYISQQFFMTSGATVWNLLFFWTAIEHFASDGQSPSKEQKLILNV